MFDDMFNPPQEGCGKDKSIEIKVILNMAPPMMGQEGHSECRRPPSMPMCDKGIMGGMPHPPRQENFTEPDWKQIAMQLLQAVSMMDTHTDGFEAGTESADGALKAIDNETSRVLWGKQEDNNPLSSYQNANYSQHTANGLMMDNMAVSNNAAAYKEFDPDVDGDVDFFNPDVLSKLFGGNDELQTGSEGRDGRGPQQGGSSPDNSSSFPQGKPSSEEEESKLKEGKRGPAPFPRGRQ